MTESQRFEKALTRYINSMMTHKDYPDKFVIAEGYPALDLHTEPDGQSFHLEIKASRPLTEPSK